MGASLADKIRGFDRVLKGSEVAELLNINPSTLYKFVSKDRIPGFKMGGKVCFDCHVLADWYEGISGGDIPRIKRKR